MKNRNKSARLEPSDVSAVSSGISETVTRLIGCFPGSFINSRMEFVASPEENQFVSLRGCETRSDVECKILEWLSRGACITRLYENACRNEAFHLFLKDGINRFLETEFSNLDFWKIHRTIGFETNHDKAVAFVESRFDISVLDRV